jgi:hypothetical protein
MEAILDAKLQRGKITAAEHAELVRRDTSFRELQLKSIRSTQVASRVENSRAEDIGVKSATTPAKTSAGKGQKTRGGGFDEHMVSIFRWTGANDFFMHCNNTRHGGVGRGARGDAGLMLSMGAGACGFGLTVNDDLSTCSFDTSDTFDPITPVLQAPLKAGVGCAAFEAWGFASEVLLG